MAYCQIDKTKYVTYIFPIWGQYIRYKILTQQELEVALNKCKLAGWKVSNIIKLSNKMLEIKSQITAKS